MSKRNKHGNYNSSDLKKRRKQGRRLDENIKKFIKETSKGR